MPNDTLDLNVNNYTIKDLLDILDLNKNENVEDSLKSINKKEINDSTQFYIDKFTTENRIDLIHFFMEIRDKLNDIMDENEGYDINNEAEIEGEKDEADSEAQPDNRNASGLISDRYEPVENQLSSGTNNNAVIKQDTIKITNTFSPTEVRGNINPLLKNTFSCFINIDSKYRQYTSNNSDTDFTLDLSEQLKKLLSLQLYSYQIPYSWYIINENVGNTCFWIEDPSTNTIVNVNISPGNYDATSLTTELNEKILEAGFYDFPSTPFTYYASKNKIGLNLFRGKYREKGKDIFTITTDTKIVFFEPFFTLECNEKNCGVKIPSHINKTLGWVLGFRTPFETVDPSGNLPIALLDLNGPRYLILVIDDFKQNHINNNIISITQYNNTLKLPSYYNTSLPYTCINSFNNYKSLTDEIELNNNINAANIIAEKLNISYTKRQNILPSNPRTLTQSQIYTINQIIKNNKKDASIYSTAPTTNDVFAIIPIKKTGFGDIITEFSGSIQSNQRIYFGPTDVTRLQISLYDDAGNLIDLNGVNWTFTMIAQCLYQF